MGQKSVGHWVRPVEVKNRILVAVLKRREKEGKGAGSGPFVKGFSLITHSHALCICRDVPYLRHTPNQVTFDSLESSQ
jgi:hypothetical protein